MMTASNRGLFAMIGAATIWGVSPIYYKLLSHVPAIDVMAHRTFWSLVFFSTVLALQGKLGEMAVALRAPRQFCLIAIAALMVSANWFLFIYATQIDQNTETSLGYYIYPLVAVLLGFFVFSERLGALQWLAVGLAVSAVAVLAIGLGELPWISLTLAATFALYGVIKKLLPIGPIVSVTCEVLLMVPVTLAILFWFVSTGEISLAYTPLDLVLLIGSGPITAFPLILFTVAARHIPMTTVGVLQYINPTLQFLCAVVLFGEVFSVFHRIAFPMIWIALILYSVSSVRQERAARRAVRASGGVSTQVRNPARDASANP